MCELVIAKEIADLLTCEWVVSDFEPLFVAFFREKVPANGVVGCRHGVKGCGYAPQLVRSEYVECIELVCSTVFVKVLVLEVRQSRMDRGSISVELEVNRYM